LDSQTPMSDGKTPRLNYVEGSGSGGGSKSWPAFDGSPLNNSSQSCTWYLTDAQTKKNLVIGANDDCIVDMDTVHLDSYIQYNSNRVNWDWTNAINSIKIKFNRNINSSSALGNGTGYWFNRQITFTYNYSWNTSSVYAMAYFDPQEYAPRSLSLSCTFVVRPNVVQSQIVGPNNLSNWVIDGSGNANYATTSDKNRNDAYTQELRIPTSVNALTDNFVTSPNLPNLKKLSEDTRTAAYTIGQNAFTNSLLETLSIPHCTSIGTRAFGWCHLTDIAAPSLVQIGDNAFESNSKLQTFFGPSVTTIGSNSFRNCTSLSSISLPNLISFPTDGSAFNITNIQQIKIGAPSNTPLTYNNLLSKTPIVTSNNGVSNFSVLIPAANAETDSTKAGWAKSYYNPVYGWTNVQTASGHMLPYFFTTYN
jgi:hypothetical protein